MDKYICPKCRKHLTDDDIMRSLCHSCHSIFDRPETGGGSLWKSLQEGLRSGHSDHIWEIGKWHEMNEDKSNEKDFSAAERVIEAMQDAPMEVLAEVEVEGEHFVKKSIKKEYWQKMRVIKAWKWEKKYSVALAIFAAEMVLQNYVKKYPKGDVPQKAIEAAKKWLDNPTEENRLAANAAGSNAWSAAELASKLTSVSSVRSVWSIIEKAAEYATRSAGQAAWAAAETDSLSAKAAGEAAVLSARSAGQAGESAAEEVLQRCENWIQRHTGELEEIK